MQILTMKLSELKKPEKNIRIHTEQQLREFERSVRMFGQIRPIVVDENNVILAGNGLYETMIRLNIDEATVYKYDNLTENQKKKLMIADNKIFSLGIENLDTLNAFLEELQGDLDIPGYDSEILEQMVSEADAITEKLSEYGTLDESEISAIKERTAKQNDAANSDRTENNASSVNTSVNKENDESGETADIRKFVTCPKCGERIWL